MVQIITNSNGGGGGVGVYKYKGSVDYYSDLPTSGMKVGDTYNVVNAFTKDGKDYPAGTNVAWTGTDWDPLGGSIDLSDYQKKLVEGDGIDLDQDTNEISVEDTVINGAAAGATALQPNDNVSELVNDAGYLVSSDLKQSDWGQTDSSKIDYIKNKPTIGNATLTIQRNGTQVNTFTANATSNVTANISVPTKTSDITNDSGFITKDVNNLTNYTLTTSLATVATSGSYNDLSNKPTIPTKTSDLNNDSGFIDKDVNNLTNYTLSSNLATVATSGSYTDLSNKPTIGDATIKIQKNSTDIDSFTTNATSGKTINISVPTTVAELSDSSDYATVASLAAVATSGSYNDLSSKPTIGTANLTIQKNGTTVATFGANATSGVTANITVPTKVTDLSDGGDYVKSASLATVATTGDYDDLTDKPTIPGVINTLTSTSTTDALSAAQGKALKDALDNISGLGKFLSLWDSSTGQPISFPLATPYTYTTGDWFMVETVDTTTNYKPNGSSYTGAASTTVESGTVKVGDVYIYDGTTWLLQVNNEPQVSFSDIAGQPTDNTNLATALGNKQDTANMVTTLSGADNTHYPTAKAVADAITAAGGGDMLASVYDPDNIEANAFDYNNFINTPNLAAVATSGAYSDLSGTPTLASVATSGSYNDLSNKPTIPAAQIQSDWTQADNTKKDYIKNKPSLATVATSGLYSDLTGTPTLATVATSGSYNDLSNKPTIPTVNDATLTIQKNGTTVKTFTANASSNVTANITVPTKTSDITNDSGYITKSVNDLTNYTLSSALATVATTGSYSDLSNKPTIPTDTSDLTNGAGFITGITSGDVTTALGYTPYNSTNPSGYVTSSIINDTAYASSWNSDTTHAPTKNAVYDKISTMDTTISGKQDSLSTQTAYTSKGTATKVPTITTNTLGQVTAISETSITFPVTSVNGNTGAVTVEEVPSGGTNGQVLTQTQNGPAWQNATGGSEIVYATQAEYNALLPGALTDNKHYFIYSTSGGGGWQPGANTIAYYPLNTDFNDASGNSRNLTNSGGTITILNGIKCAYYNGSSYSMYNDYSLSNTTRTISIWVNKTNVGVPIMISDYSSNNYSGSLAVSFYSSYLLVADNYGAQAFAESCSTNTWYNVIVVQEGNTVKGYINGVLKGTSTTRPNQTPTGWSLGATHYSGHESKYSGYIGETILENKARTAQEISDYYDLTKGDYGIS